MRPLKVIFGFALLLLALLAGRVVEAAQPGEPGPRSKAHQGLGTWPTACNQCHDAGMGVPDDKCLGCHTHQPLRVRIQAGKGFHASEEVKKENCKTCHAEHKEEPPGSGKGRQTTIDWKRFGAKRNFNHRLTGWALDGAHRSQECEKCHTAKYPQTKLPSYLGNRQECTTCHFGKAKDKGVGGENPHQFTDSALTNCSLCHSFNNFKVQNLEATKYDHDKTQFPLVGFHQKNKCVDCHKDNIETFKVKKDLGTCKSCHEDSHKSVISATRKCDSCHSEKTNFKQTKFDHGKETRFPLRGQHQKNRCQDCHKINSPPQKPTMNCVGCHKDIHETRFNKETCDSCHAEVGWKTIKFAHDKKTKFDLTGAHEDAKCADCHRGGVQANFERFETTDCASCHRHEKAHCGQFGLVNCERCHVRGGDRTSKFDHNLTRFPLERAHSVVECARCHSPMKLGESAECRNAVKYTGLDPQCASCHADVHDGELGKDCTKCHTGGATFKILAFDHNRDSAFSLTGFHQLVGCDQCHPGRKFKLPSIQCYSCHAKDDVHQQRLGNDCAKCHETTGGAPKFDHNVHTKFKQEGVHARIECQRCHFLLASNPDGKPIPKAEGVKEAAKPVLPGADSVKGVAVAPPGAPIDLLFRTSGSACNDCHPDPHNVREDLACDSCHAFEKWKAPPRNDYHTSAGFSLTGAHTILACATCHTGAGNMKGRGVRCGSCHVQDDIHAGSFGSECGKCHMQEGWVPTTFTHADTGFILQGLHRTLECRQCHLAGNFFIGKNPSCANCHLRDYFGSTWHQDVTQEVKLQPYILGGGTIQGGPMRSLDCDACHTQFTFHGAISTVPK